MKLKSFQYSDNMEKAGIVPLNNGDSRIYNFPDFLIVGPQRTGSTWLSHCLKNHPYIFFSSPKEIHFFNLLSLPYHPLYNSNSLKWYLDFFNTAGTEQIIGEGTASYAVLNDTTIKAIHDINPAIKAIISIRNPVDRAWSHVQKDLFRVSTIQPKWKFWKKQRGRIIKKQQRYQEKTYCVS